jgi:hypothetical protein
MTPDLKLWYWRRPWAALFEDLDRVKLSIFLVRAGADKTFCAPYHVEKIHRLLPQPHHY